jgi:hypothetical protein
VFHACLIFLSLLVLSSLKVCRYILFMVFSIPQHRMKSDMRDITSFYWNSLSGKGTSSKKSLSSSFRSKIITKAMKNMKITILFNFTFSVMS